MKLVKPTKRYSRSWKNALKEFEKEKRSGFWNVPEKPNAIDEYIKRTSDHSKGRNIPSNWMPATTYWLIDNDAFVGHVNIRHKLVDWSKKIGGHIGFAIRPTKQRQGYGSNILRLALKKAKILGLKKVLVTCDNDNIGSRKIIERNGGVLKKKITLKGKRVRHYWIEII
jgi:predicted acetyltransferase